MFCLLSIFIIFAGYKSYLFMEANLNVLLADDHCIVKKGIEHFLKELFGNVTVTKSEFFDKICAYLKEEVFDLIVIEVTISDLKAIDMIAMIKKIQPNIKLLVFTDQDEDLFAIKYLKAGADGFLRKISSEFELQRAFFSIIETGKFISEAILQKIALIEANVLKENPIEVLSPRELEIARFLVSGNGNLEISNQIGIKTSTVSTYKKRILKKLGVKNSHALTLLFGLYDQN